MSSKLCLLLLILLHAIQSTGKVAFSTKDSTDRINNEFSFQAGILSSIPFTKQEPLKLDGHCECDYPPYVYTSYPEHGYRIALLYDYRIAGRLLIRAGVGLLHSNSKVEGDTADLNLVTTKWMVSGFDPTVVRKDFSYYHLMIPLSVGIKLNDFQIFGSMQTILMESLHIIKTDYNGQSRTNFWSSFDDPIVDILSELSVYWRLEGYYLIRNTLKDFHVFTGATWYSNSDDWEVSLGLKVPLLSKSQSVGN